MHVSFTINIKTNVAQIAETYKLTRMRTAVR